MSLSVVHKEINQWNCRNIQNATLQDTVAFCNSLTVVTRDWVASLEASRPTDPAIMRLREELLRRFRDMESAVLAVSSWSQDQIKRNFPICRGGS